MSWSAQQVAALIRLPDAHDDKYSRGVLGVVTGSAEYPGAAVLGVEAAYRTGLGMVRYLGDVPTPVLARRPEAVTQSGRVNAWLIGSGISLLSPTATMLQAAVVSGVPVVLDAGALDALVLQQFEWAGPLVLTPHAGEAARLLGRDRAAVEAEPAAAAAELAATFTATVVLKGSVTHIAGAAGETLQLGPASPWLATAGTGDVLAGIVGALLASQPTASPVDLAATAVWLHDAAARSVGGPFTALDLAEALPAVIRGVMGGRNGTVAS
ncbi:MAG: ADP-dependent NAD(P)H-hydrate dehydratase [Microbacteriaceae bacterium]